jgi:hypothetical protein
LRRTDPVLSRARREELRAEAVDDTLLVQRWLGEQRRALVLHFGPGAPNLAGLADRLQLRAAVPLLQSSEGAWPTLPPGNAVMLALDADRSLDEAEA